MLLIQIAVLNPGIRRGGNEVSDKCGVWLIVRMRREIGMGKWYLRRHVAEKCSYVSTVWNSVP